MWLFGKPEWELKEKINPEIIKSKGDELKERLYEVADNLQKLSDNGWDYELCLYDINLSKNTSKKDAENELTNLGINEEVYEQDED